MSAVTREILEAVVLAVVVFIAIQASMQNFRVEGQSMSPTLKGSQYLVVNKLSYWRFDQNRLARIIPFWRPPEVKVHYPFSEPQFGDIIVFRYPSEPRRDFVKRVVGLPGDEVEIVAGKLKRNGQTHLEPYVANPDSVSLPPRVLAKDEYFVMGDNRGYSNDSRDWGPVPDKNIIGRVWLVYWPFSEAGAPN